MERGREERRRERVKRYEAKSPLALLCSDLSLKHLFPHPSSLSRMCDCKH